MSDAREHLIKGFVEGVHSQPEHVLSLLEPSEAFQNGHQAAREVIAAAVWAKSLGDRLDTRQVAGLLGVTRQALGKRLAARTMLGLPGKNTTYYPSWQFDFTAKEVRREVPAILKIFADEGITDSHTIAAWATAEQPEDLGGETPAGWLREDREPAAVLESAFRTARRLAE